MKEGDCREAYPAPTAPTRRRKPIVDVMRLERTVRRGTRGRMRRATRNDIKGGAANTPRAVGRNLMNGITAREVAAATRRQAVWSRAVGLGLTERRKEAREAVKAGRMKT